jgi:hypothetical protein
LRYGDTRDGEREWSLGSLTSCGGWTGSQSFWAGGEPGDAEHEHDGREPDEDREPECEDEGADTDDEPWLGALQNVDQRTWAHDGDGWAVVGLADDSELEPDNRSLPRTLPPWDGDEAAWAKWREWEDAREREGKAR